MRNIGCNFLYIETQEELNALNKYFTVSTKIIPSYVKFSPYAKAYIWVGNNIIRAALKSELESFKNEYEGLEVENKDDKIYEENLEVWCKEIENELKLLTVQDIYCL